MSVSIGVIIPTYDRSEQTLEAVECVLNQSRPPEQVIVVDDGSPEDSRQDLIQKLQDYPVQLVLRPHCGHPGRVRNEGLSLVETTHVAFLDSDDLWVTEKLEIQEELARSGIRAQGSGYITSGLSSRVESVAVQGTKTLTLRELLIANVLCNSSVLVESALLHEIGGLPTSYGVRGIEDYAAWLRIATITNWMFLEAPLVIYSDSPATSMRGTNEFSISERTLALLDFTAWLRDQGRRVPPAISLATKVGDRALMEWAARQRI